MRWVLACLAGLLLLHPAFAITPAARVSIEQTRLLMGSRLTILLPLFEGQESQAQQVLEAAFREVERVDTLLSHYRPDSPLSQLSSSAGTFTRVDPELFQVLKRCSSASRKTQGAFDVTVGPLIRAWKRQGNAEDLQTARSLVGWRKLERRPGNRLRLKQVGMALDPGGFGKGYAVDRLVEVLRARGISHAFINFGGSSLYGLGDSPEGPGWLVQLPQLPGREGRAARVLLKNQSLSTSATLSPTETGARGQPHVVDPRSGGRIEEERVAAVLTSNAMDADVLSTALLVLGRPGLALLARRFRGAEAFMLDVQGEAESSGMRLRRLEAEVLD